MTIEELNELTGGLSDPSKMPCRGYGLPARECHAGSKLRAVPGSVCEKCYALKGHYAWDNVQRAQYNRLDRVTNNPLWHEHMAELIERKERSGYFRWHDSGDLQSERHLEQILWVAEQTPHIKFWLPTREYELASRVLTTHALPKNMRIRLGAHIIDGPMPMALATRLGISVSGVSADPKKVSCPSHEQNNSCADCRRCWSTKPVVYLKH